eukprot:NODE_36_length_36011_cov_1.012920.p26 type:complete len:108 gc:universal NODE_36_length_36011_cov_1.012920:11378-11701(+)
MARKTKKVKKIIVDKVRENKLSKQKLKKPIMKMDAMIDTLNEINTKPKEVRVSKKYNRSQRNAEYSANTSRFIENSKSTLIKQDPLGYIKLYSEKLQNDKLRNKVQL